MKAAKVKKFAAFLMSKTMIYAKEPIQNTIKLEKNQQIAAIGDVHGHYKLYTKLIKYYGKHHKKALVISLGDITDRGPQNLECLYFNLLSYYKGQTPLGNPFHWIFGNHCQYLFSVIQDKSLFEEFDMEKSGIRWLYDIIKKSKNPIKKLYTALAVANNIPLREAEILIMSILEKWEDKRIPFWYKDGNALFVHGGVHPENIKTLGVEKYFSQFDPTTHNYCEPMRIREIFTQTQGPYGPNNDMYVIHGHTHESKTPNDVKEGELGEFGFRIGLDAGSYKTGVIGSALLENQKCQFILSKEKQKS